MDANDFLPLNDSPTEPADEITPEEPTTNNVSITSNKGLTFEMIKFAKIAKPDLTLEQASVLFGCTTTNLKAHCTRNSTTWTGIIPGLKEFKTHRADMLASMQQTALSGITSDKLKNASPRDCATIFGIFYDKERLERGHDAEGSTLDLLARAMARATGYMLGVEDAVLIKEDDDDLPPIKRQAIEDKDE
jgi:hypothetical protein